MGASAREIEREIKATRERMDENLTRLERTRRPTLRDRLDGLSLANLRTLAAAATGRWKDRLPSVTVRVNEKTDEEPGTLETILREVAPALVATAGSALLQRVAGPPDDEYAPPQAE